MKDQRLHDYLGHMLDAAETACSYIKDQHKETFISDKLTQQAVILNLVIIGEAATKIAQDYPDFVAQQSHIPWKNMKGMRNRIAHGYFDINLDIVWSTVESALPTLIEQLRALRDKS